ncbi:MAG: ComEC/Rec2 family competence protein, partial [Nitriliruptoraceae bacterium]
RTTPARAVAGALGVVPVWAVAAVAGARGGEALAGRHDARSVALVALVAATVGVLALAAWARRQRCVVWSCAAGIAATSLVALVCAGGAAARVDAREHGLLPALARTGGEAEVEAVVAAEPRPIDRGWHVLIRVTEVDGRATRERAALVLPDDPPALGQRWRATVTAQPLPEGGYGRWLGRQHAVALLDVHSFEPSGRPGIAARVSEHVRERVRAAATHHLDDRVGGLLVGFVTGDTRLLPDEDRANMEATALTHLTAVSGSNVAIVIAGVVGAVTLLGAGARGRWAAVALAVPWFAYLTRFEPSVMRAGTMAALLLVADARGQARDARHALGVAVLVLLLVDPLLAGSLGLVLSATATAGVLVIAPVVRRRLPDRLPRPLATLVSITVGVQVAVVPVVLASFGELTLASIPANLVAVPAAMVAATLSFIGTVLALVHVELGAVAFALAAPGSWVTLTAADGLAGVGGVAELGRPATILALLGGCGWLLSRPRGRVARWWALATTVGLVAAMLPAVTATLPRNDFTVTAIDVGQSDAFLLESPSTRVLVDAGGDDSAARWLRTNGRRALDLVVVTHPHLDHVGGIAEVLETVEVGMVWAAPLATELPEAAEVHQVAAERGVPVRAPVAGEETVIGDLYIEVLHPPPGRPYRHEQSELNDSSYVLRFHHGEQRVLATGDVEAAAQRDLLDGDVEQLAAELMTVPHHGATTTEPAFITAVGAQIGLIGVGADNRHGHPHECILELLARDKVEVHRTDLDGTVTVPVPERRPRTPTSRSPAVAAGCTGAR